MAIAAQTLNLPICTLTLLVSEMQKITPFITYEKEAEQAAELYTSVIPNSLVVRKVRAPDTNKVLTVQFQLAGLNLIALNMGEPITHSHGFSLSVACETQPELDRIWDKLCDGGSPNQCGWLTDRFGVSWQIVPSHIERLVSGTDSVRSARAMQAMMSMVKLDIARLQAAYNE